MNKRKRRKRIGKKDLLRYINNSMKMIFNIKYNWKFNKMMIEQWLKLKLRIKFRLNLIERVNLREKINQKANRIMRQSQVDGVIKKTIDI